MKLEVVLAARGPRVLTIDAAASIRVAVARLAEHNIGALVVVDAAGHPIGILSERDVIRALAAGEDALALTVGDLMTSPVIAATPADDAEAVLQTMTTNHFRHVPIVDHGVLVGIVTIGDLVRAQLIEVRGEVVTLETRLMDA
ncbi:MAG: CBS domain-containing protein [Dehalococcoidia bacterium]|nr:CBS domain-containing protein [Dehalococcoidia bacterium]